jgi:hypothetical protein
MITDSSLVITLRELTKAFYAKEILKREQEAKRAKSDAEQWVQNRYAEILENLPIYAAQGKYTYSTTTNGKGEATWEVQELIKRLCALGLKAHYKLQQYPNGWNRPYHVSLINIYWG